ncbi:MAG: hypothetical protein H7A23_18365 [Leptospiraceae bacterium]|nr:hypothetical protein [Leptospiraceae bacterium]MCP5496515.1 hypothetical protein [Leptospiraceae bacterium]
MLGIIIKIALIFLGIGLWYFAYKGITTNILVIKFGQFTREQHPIAFWIFTVSYIFMGFVLIIGGIFA